MRQQGFALALIAALLCVFPPAAASAETAEGRRLFQTGMNQYASGKHALALASFQEVLRLEPRDRSALAAVRRLESETRSRAEEPATARITATPPGLFERFFLEALPRWYYFERTLGDGLRDVGTLNALNARVVQLLGERKAALAQGRAFGNDRQLRALLRRAPAATQGLEKV